MFYRRCVWQRQWLLVAVVRRLRALGQARAADVSTAARRETKRGSDFDHPKLMLCTQAQKTHGRDIDARLAHVRRLCT